MRLREIGDRADNLTTTSIYDDYSQSAGGQTTRDRDVQRLTCTGSRCEGDQGTSYDVQDPLNDAGTLLHVASLLDPRAGDALTGLRLGTRGDFDTSIATVEVHLQIDAPDFTVTDFPSVSGYGFWGEHGWASVQIGDGPWAGTEDGVSFTGNFRWAEAYAAGDASGSNPAGLGSATWTGIAEAASTETFRRHQGTATLTIADLSRPRVDADIVIGGASIASPAWSGMALADGRYETGTAGTDRIQGDFYGPNHGETYGIFDTDAYVGAFGARREQ
ncbi:MAG: hypothetical protein OXI22_24315 [Defluviicoccus sp.]|nr:hypothetical protein [Defluviicoccus sp.]MDE0387026.1 hypothetical protein [Defluviicoccus sp.]